MLNVVGFLFVCLFVDVLKRKGEKGAGWRGAPAAEERRVTLWQDLVRKGVDSTAGLANFASGRRSLNLHQPEGMARFL